MKCVPHSANSSLVTVFTLHMMGALPNAGPHIEFTIENDSWARISINQHSKCAMAKWLANAKREVSERT